MTATRTTKGQSTGPKTAAGKARSALNATTHGLSARHVPEHERGDYELHRRSIVADLRPVGYLEEELAHRAALSSWHRRRLEAYAAHLQEAGRRRKVEQALYPSDKPWTIRPPRAIGALAPVAALDVASAVSAVGNITGYDPRPALLAGKPIGGMLYELREAPDAVLAFIEDNDPVALANRSEVGLAQVVGAVLDWITYQHATVDKITTELAQADIKANETIATHGRTFDRARKDGNHRLTHEDLVVVLTLAEKYARHLQVPGLWPQTWWYHEAVRRLRAAVPYVRRAFLRASHLLEEARQSAQMPNDLDLKRYERHAAHHDREFYRALHELEGRQKLRSGLDAPLVRLDIHGGEPTAPDGRLPGPVDAVPTIDAVGRRLE